MKNFFSKRSLRYFSIILASVALLTAVAVTFMWLLNNKKLEANDIQMNVGVVPSLVISDSASDIVKMDRKSESPFEITFTDSTKKRLQPATHASHATKSEIGDTISSSFSGLEFVANPELISQSTGLLDESQSTGLIDDDTLKLEYRIVPIYRVGDDNKYYFEFIAYIASLDEEMTGKKIQAQIEYVSPDTFSDYTVFNSCTVDFIVDDVYMGKLNPLTDGTTTTTDNTILTGPLDIYSGAIPYNKSKNKNSPSYIQVIMRTYFDGELTDSTGKAYINTDTVSTEKAAKPEIKMNVTFTAVDG